MQTQLGRTIKEQYRSGMTRASLAEQLRVSPALVRAWERGADMPNEVKFDQLLDVLRIDRKSELCWNLRQEQEQWNAADHTRSVVLEAVIFLVLTPVFYRLLANFFEWLTAPLLPSYDAFLTQIGRAHV